MARSGKARPTLRRKLLWAAIAVAAVLALQTGSARYLAGRFKPFLRDQTVNYLENRFDGDVELASFDVSMPIRDPLRMLLEKGKGARPRVRIDGVSIRDRLPLHAPLRIQNHLEIAAVRGDTRFAPVGAVDEGFQQVAAGDARVSRVYGLVGTLLQADRNIACSALLDIFRIIAGARVRTVDDNQREISPCRVVRHTQELFDHIDIDEVIQRCRPFAAEEIPSRRRMSFGEIGGLVAPER